MFLRYLLFALEALLPAGATALFYYLNEKTKFGKLSKVWKQIIYGVTFGLIAVLGTHLGINTGTATINARDAAALSAGLVFGAPAGVIAGLIGGLERILAPVIDPSRTEGFFRGVGSFTTAACSISTCIAGIAGAILRKFVYDDKRPGLISGFFSGFVIEVFHLFMVFVLRASEYQKAFIVVQACVAPMLIANSFGVLASLLVISLLEKGKTTFKRADARGLNSRFIVVLSTLTAIAFVLSTSFIALFQGEIQEKQTFNTLDSSLTETSNEVAYKTIEQAYNVRESLLEDFDKYKTSEQLLDLCHKVGIIEINIIDNEGIIQYSSETQYVDGHYDAETEVDADGNPAKDSEGNIIYKKDADGNYIGGHNFNMNDGDQSKEFNILLGGEVTEFVQEFRQMADVEKLELRKYAGITLDYMETTPDLGAHIVHGYLQVGYDQDGVDALVQNVTQYKNVGETGSVLIMNIDDQIVSAPSKFVVPEEEYDEMIFNIKNTAIENDVFEIEVGGVKYYAQYRFEDSHTIISFLPISEAMLMKNISIFVNTFLEIIVFGLLFGTIYLLTKKLVIDRVYSTNASLAKITNGDLDVLVKGGNTTEFVELADGINQTVGALKGHIEAAKKRIDEELAMAKTIQAAVLPSTFPAFPDRKEFDVHASMHPAKEVGGDFYDFYFSNHDTFHITIADVSGKGIPAALFMMRAKSILKSLSQTNMKINEAFAEGNNALCEGNEAGMFVTAWSGTIDLITGTLSFANGGHNPPLIKHANGKFEYLKAPVNLVLAAMDGMPYGINQVKLQPGDIVYLYTDGVTEGVNTKVEQFGEERLQNALNSQEFASCKDICDHIYEECMKFADGAAQFDDITMLAFKYNGIK